MICTINPNNLVNANISFFIILKASYNMMHESVFETVQARLSLAKMVKSLHGTLVLEMD